MNSKRKGKTGELELAQIFRNNGYIEAKRGQQYSGLNGDADVVGVKGLHIECKRCQQVRDEAFLQQAERDARKGEIPAVFFRRNNEEWKVLQRLDTFLIIWNELTDEQKQNIHDKIKLSVK